MFAVLLASALLFLPRVARAADDAETHWNNGVSLYGEGDYPASLVEFKRAYEIQPNYNFLYNIGQVYWTLKDYVSAVKTYQQYLTDGGARIGATRRGEVEKDIASGKGRIATVTITVNTPGSEVFIDDVSIGMSPLKESVQINSGKRKFVATHDGFNPAREVKEFAGGDNGTITLALVALKPGETPKPPDITPPGGTGNGNGNGSGNGNGPTPKPAPSSPSAVGPVVTFALTGAFAIAWGVTGGLALAADADLDTLKQSKTTKPDLDDAASKASTLAIVSDVMMVTTIVGAGVATAVTIATFSGGGKSDEKAGKIDLKVGVGRVGLRATF